MRRGTESAVAFAVAARRFCVRRGLIGQRTAHARTQVPRTRHDVINVKTAARGHPENLSVHSMVEAVCACVM